jgi:hypothetical protein
MMILSFLFLKKFYPTFNILTRKSANNKHKEQGAPGAARASALNNSGLIASQLRSVFQSRAIMRYTLFVAKKL